MELSALIADDSCLCLITIGSAQCPNTRSTTTSDYQSQPPPKCRHLPWSGRRTRVSIVISRCYSQDVVTTSLANVDAHKVLAQHSSEFAPVTPPKHFVDFYLTTKSPPTFFVIPRRMQLFARTSSPTCSGAASLPAQGLHMHKGVLKRADEAWI
ncbi:unnamed protein product [Rhizoctonia solani]|uniref:Uncharacterized protein n=1 Tax=Rhizoctonia solani TaxID=456999 RepID=A0A8H3HXD8_9AGAM|nr:unnamed protein product [Rhizoctonia solani]